MTENKNIDETVVKKHIEIRGDDVGAGTDSPQSAPEAPKNEEKNTENDTQNQQDAVEKTDGKEDTNKD